MNKMLEDLAEVVRLSKKATAGEWAQDNPSSADITSPTGDVAITICKAMNNLDLSEKESIAEKKRESAFYNAAFIAASVNFIRAHHAEIAQNAEAAKRLEAAERDASGEREESWEVWQDDMPVAQSSDYTDAQHYLMMYAQDGPVKLVRVVTYRQDIDAAIAPVQASAVPDGYTALLSDGKRYWADTPGKYGEWRPYFLGAPVAAPQPEMQQPDLAAITQTEQARGEVVDDCDVCHEPLADGCACQDEYRREHDSGDLER